jgi:flagellin-like hook-associated protein FlgL
MATPVVAGKLVFTPPNLPGAPESADNSPREALRRLQLTGLAGKNYGDIVALGATDLDTVARQLDDERDSLETNFGRGATADSALVKLEDSLKQVDDLVTENEKSGLSHADRIKNQKQIDKLLAGVDEALTSAGDVTERVLNGETTVAAGGESIQIDRTSLASLGHIPGNGHTLSLRDLFSGKALDTSTHKHSAIELAHKTTTKALATVGDLRTKIESFQRDTIRPRLGDVANAMQGLFAARAETLTSSATALQTAADLRNILLSSATFAAAVGADGWDKERVLALVSPTGG